MRQNRYLRHDLNEKRPWHREPVTKAAFVGPTSKDAMKLRMTGFECSPSFVILRASDDASSVEVEARHCTATLVSVFHEFLMSFPIYFDAGISLRDLSHVGFITQI